MGTLVDQSIKSFFQGVSKQPDSFRNPGQVDEAFNVQFSVERGGFTKRIPTKHVAKLTASVYDGALHTIDRDESEKYTVAFYNGGLRVHTPDGTEKTVTVVGAAGAYLAGLSPSDVSFVSIADYTLVLNRTKVVALGGAKSPLAQNKAVLFVNYAMAGSYKVIVNGTTYTGAGSTDGVTVATNIATALAALGAGWTITRDSVFVFLEKVDGSSFTLATEDPYSNQGLKATYLKVKQSNDLPGRAPNGLVVRVGSDMAAEYYVKSEQLNTGSNEVRWVETIAPDSFTSFDPTTMPHFLIRNGGGNFDFQAGTWADKKVGTTKTVPNPDFVGEKIRDLVIHRNRLHVFAGETEFMSAAGDYFNFWKQKSTEVLDDDPYGHTASTNEVALLEWAVPFRKALFSTAANVQFEVSGELLTPKKSSMDVATKYSVSTKCRPVSIGDSLYLPSADGNGAVLWEYLYDDNSVTNTAVDATKHCRGYIPATIHDMCADSVNGHLFMLSTFAPGSIYVYTFFWNGDEKVQQAFGTWTFDGAVRAISFMNGNLYILIQRPDGLCIERVSIGSAGYENFSWVPRMDRNVELTGVYSSLTNLTTWTLPFTPNGTLFAVTSNLLPAGKRMLDLTLTITGANTVAAKGDWSGGAALIGNTYESLVRLSKLYVRDADQSAILGGRANVRNITFQYEDSGYFEVRVTPEARPSKLTAFTGRIIGSALNMVSSVPILSGKFKARVGSKAETVTIEVLNSSPHPFTITSAVWVAFFNELTRQEA